MAVMRIVSLHLGFMAISKEPLEISISTEEHHTHTMKVS